MKGLDSFEIKREMTLQELATFMEEHWDKEEFGSFYVGDPKDPNLDTKTKYIVLPATEGWCVIIYPKSGGLLKKKNQIKAACTYTSAGAMKLVEHGRKIGKYHGVSDEIKDARNAKELNQEMNTVADGIMRAYMEYLKNLMGFEGLV